MMEIESYNNIEDEKEKKKNPIICLKSYPYQQLLISGHLDN